MQHVTSSAGADLGDVVRCSNLNEVSGGADLTTLSHSGQSSLSAGVKFAWSTWLGNVSYRMTLVSLVKHVSDRLYVGLSCRRMRLSSLTR
ncbi:hypothetical protein EON65_46900 [archaeon]|nr:MAG: hypothetical protein EON65_46900 [archaeon]